MTAARRRKRTPTVLRIEGELTIYRAEELKRALLAEPAPVEVDLSGVTDVDTAGVQLLMLAKREALAQQREFKLGAHSLAVIDVFELLNLAAYFDDPMLMGACTSDARTASINAARRSHES